ncbi:MAG: hypothetical protein ACI9QC_000231 [Oceanicoccus sp.]|jgi:hypothetical protein
MPTKKQKISGDQLSALDQLIESIVDDFLEMLHEDDSIKKRLVRIILAKANIDSAEK